MYFNIRNKFIPFISLIDVRTNIRLKILNFPVLKEGSLAFEENNTVCFS